MEPKVVKSPAHETANVRDILERTKLAAHFQQIVSVSRKKVIGVEGLVRGIHADTNELILPKTLFDAAREEKVIIELDRACRNTILTEFGKIHCFDREKLLFLNLDASILEMSIGSGYLLNQVKKHNINPCNIVIEINERYVLNNMTLKRFVDTYKRYGFMVALDDVGTGFSNMDRILLVKPDIIKIDISLVKNIHNDFYKQGIFRSLVILANKVGALVIAEGVETEQEAIQVLRLGGHMIQGYYFSTPAQIKDGCAIFINHQIDALGKRFNEYVHLQYIAEKDRYKQLNVIVNESVQKLSRCCREEYDGMLRGIVSECADMECAYILDGDGIQVSGTICAQSAATHHESLIFYSARIGTDHSMEKYYYPLSGTKRKRFTTEPYVSLATGNLCITISAVFADGDNNKCILCADFKSTEESYSIELKGPVANPVAGIATGAADIDAMGGELFVDSLTGAYNRRYIDQRFMTDMAYTVNHNQPLSIVLGDLDRFKDINDRFGHLAGDWVLKEFVKISKRCIGGGNAWIARYGGDEFLIVMVDADKAAVDQAAEKIRSECEKAAIAYGGSQIRFTVSLGAHTSSSSILTIDEIIGLADKNLYTAKRSGRNRLVH